MGPEAMKSDSNPIHAFGNRQADFFRRNACAHKECLGFFDCERHCSASAGWLGSKRECRVTARQGATPDGL